MRMSVKHVNEECMFGILTIGKIIPQGDQAHITPSSMLMLDSKMLFWVRQVQTTKTVLKKSFKRCSISLKS